MYQYDNIDQTLVDERVEQFREQTERYLSGDLSDAQFLPLRLQKRLPRSNRSGNFREHFEADVIPEPAIKSIIAMAWPESPEKSGLSYFCSGGCVGSGS